MPWNVSSSIVIVCRCVYSCDDLRCNRPARANGVHRPGFALVVSGSRVVAITSDRTAQHGCKMAGVVAKLRVFDSPSWLLFAGTDHTGVSTQIKRTQWRVPRRQLQPDACRVGLVASRPGPVHSHEPGILKVTTRVAGVGFLARAHIDAQMVQDAAHHA